MKTRLINLVVLILVASIALTACGGEAQPTAKPTDKPTDVPTQTTGGGETPVVTTPLLDGETLLNERCTTCHNLNRVTSESKNAADWKVTVDRMVRKGAELTADEVEVLVKFLAEKYGE